MIKRIAIIFTLCSLPLYTPMASAQLRQPEPTMKHALADFLYQYGVEVFNRGIDIQEASFVFQRALVLDCHHQGAKAFLERLHRKYPSIDIRIWGCQEEPVKIQEPKDESLRNERHRASLNEDDDSASTMTSNDESSPVKSTKRKLHKECQEFVQKIEDLEKVVRNKDEQIEQYKQQLASKVSTPVDQEHDDASYAAIAQDQKDLIRIQQNNIDYLKSELAELKRQGVEPNAVAPNQIEYSESQKQVADFGLESVETKIELADKDEEIRSLQQKLDDLQQQLELIQKIVDEKNKMIETLQTQASQ